MELNLPDIEVKFKQLASTFIERSERGIAILIIKDTTNFSHIQYEDIEDLKSDKSKYTSENYTNLMDVMHFGCAKLGVVVINEDNDDDITTALKIIGQKYRTGWIGGILEPSEHEAVKDWIIKKEKENYTFKAIIKGDNSDHPCVHEVDGISVTFADERGKKGIEYYIPSLLGIASACNINRGMTYYICDNLTEVEEVENVKASLNKGKLILINDYDVVRIALGINSLTTFDGEETFEDMRYIDIMEAMHMMKDDIREVYKTEYVGKCKNKLDNQILFISAIKTYFENLEDEEVEILDNNYDNVVDVDVENQRKAWVKIKPEAKTWSDAKVKNTSYKRTTFIAGDVKILGAMENLKMNITTN